MSGNADRLKTKFWLFERKAGRLTFFMSLGVIITLIIDSSLSRISDIIPTSSVLNTNLALFVIISLVCGAGQFLFLRMVSGRTTRIDAKKDYHNLLRRIIVATQFALIAVVVLIILQLTTTSQYPVAALMLILTISYSLGTFIVSLLSKHFFSWYRIEREPLLLVYGIATICLAVHLAFTLSLIDFILADLPGTVRTQFSTPPYMPPGSLKDTLGTIYVITSIVSFISMWIATTLLLYSHAQKLGKWKYWIVVSLPVVYFLSQFPAFFFQIFNPLISADPFFYVTFLTLIFSISKPAGGVLFGIGFWSVARTIRGSEVREYLLISSYGLVLLFCAEQGFALINGGYPPFGLNTILFLGLSTYLVFNGIFYSAMSVSQDSKLRREIKHVANESKILDQMGSAQFEQQVRNKWTAIAKFQNDMVQKTGIESSYAEKEALEYLEKLLKERKMNEKRNEPGHESK